jgi:capsule polysaccharide modification protein KpsS
MQKVGDASLRGTDIFSWTEQTVKEIRQVTDRQIIVRPHPLYRRKTQHAKCKETVCDHFNVQWQEADVTQEGFVPIQEQLQNAWCTVTYSSGTGIDAVLNGTPNIACDTGSMVYDVSSTDIKQVEEPYRGDKKVWTNKIAHCQWSIEEFESGECWEHVNKSLT